MLTEKPAMIELQNKSVVWTHRFNLFTALSYNPKNDKNTKVLNYGFEAPYLIVFWNGELNAEKCMEWCCEKELDKIASYYASSVLFIVPNSGSWDNASSDILNELVSNSKIHQYYGEGYVKNVNRFTKETEGYYIRGAIYRMCLYGVGKSADYIAMNCIRHFEGDGLWGRSDIAPIMCTLENLSVNPLISCRDIAVVSVGNDSSLNEKIKSSVDRFIEHESSAYSQDIDNLGKNLRRMVGTLEIDPDVCRNGLVREPGVISVRTSEDNCGDDAGTQCHDIGYFAFYNRGIMDKESVPLVLAFHGGGDSAIYISIMSGWAAVANRHNFLLVCVENHCNSTATEMQELITHLKGRYNIDSSRIYASGFSMGGVKTWDFVQEYPNTLAACAPMDATYEVGLNVYGKPMRTMLNESVSVPIFYTGGGITPLPELPCQALKCYERELYVAGLNKVARKFDFKFDEQDKWTNKIWGISGDKSVSLYDNYRKDTLDLELFLSENGKCYTVFGSIRQQGHECREHTCENAWRFMRNFSRNENGEIQGGDIDDIAKQFV